MWCILCLHIPTMKSLRFVCIMFTHPLQLWMCTTGIKYDTTKSKMLTKVTSARVFEYKTSNLKKQKQNKTACVHLRLTVWGLRMKPFWSSICMELEHQFLECTILVLLQFSLIHRPLAPLSKKKSCYNATSCLAGWSQNAIMWRHNSNYVGSQIGNRRASDLPPYMLVG